MPTTDLTRLPSRRLTREEHKLAATLREAQLPGQRAAAKIESAAFATHVALTHATMLSAAEGRAIAYAPLGEARYKVIADAFAGYCCKELSLLAFQS
jgi:hypothetical protein